jgi:hypothetical protein
MVYSRSGRRARSSVRPHLTCHWQQGALRSQVAPRPSSVMPLPPPDKRQFSDRGLPGGPPTPPAGSQLRRLLQLRQISVALTRGQPYLDTGGGLHHDPERVGLHSA